MITSRNIYECPHCRSRAEEKTIIKQHMGGDHVKVLPGKLNVSVVNMKKRQKLD